MPNEFVARNGIIALNNSSITGSLDVSGGITGSLFGTASWASNAVTSSYILNAVSASFATTASYVLNAVSSSFASTASFVVTAQTASFVQNAQTASYVLNAVSASFATSASFASNAANATSASFASTASFVQNAQSASFATRAITASYADNFTVAGTLTAQTIVVQTITSSQEFVTGSTRFGSLLANTHQFTGSVSITGSLAVNGSNVILTNQTSSMSVATASYVLNAVSASFASTASSVNTLNQAVTISGSFTVFTGSAVEFQVTNTGVKIGNAITDTHTVTGSLTISGSTVITGSLLISTGSLSDFLRTSNAGITNFRISSSGYPVWGVPGYDVVSVPGATWTPTVSWDGLNVQWGDIRANRSIMTPGIGGGYITVPNITFIGTYTTQINNLFGSSFIVNNNNVTSTLGTVNMVIQATGSQTGNMLQFKNGAGSVQSAFTSNASLLLGTSTDAGFRLDVNGTSRFSNNMTVSGSTIISGSFTVFTGSAVEFQVTNTGVRIGNIVTDTHTVTGSLNISGSSHTVTGSVNIVGSVSASGNIYQGGTGNASTVLASSGNTALLTLSSTGATINMGRVGAISLLANSTDGGIIMNDGAYLGVSSGTLRIGSNLAANNVVIGNFANSTATINGNTTISGSTVITGSFTVITGSAVEFRVTNTGVNIGNVITDVHTVTGSFNISGSGFVHGGGFIVSGTLATSGSGSQGLVAPLKFTTAPVNTNYTLVYTDEGKMVEMNYNVDAPLTVTIPLNSSVAFPIGTEISVIQIGAGTTVITGSSGVTVNSYLGYKTIDAQYGVASVVKRGTDSWYLFGNLS